MSLSRRENTWRFSHSQDAGTGSPIWWRVACSCSESRNFLKITYEEVCKRTRHKNRDSDPVGPGFLLTGGWHVEDRYCIRAKRPNCREGPNGSASSLKRCENEFFDRAAYDVPAHHWNATCRMVFRKLSWPRKSGGRIV